MPAHYGKNVSGMKSAKKTAGVKKVAGKAAAPKKATKMESKLKRGR